MYKSIQVVVLALALVLLPGAQLVRAEDAPATKSALAVSPAIIEEVLEPGKPTPFTLQVNNITNFPLPIKTMIRNFVVQSETFEKTERDRLDASQWFNIEDPDFILQPNQVRTVKGVLQPPADAVPGGHYATIYFQPLIPQEALSPATAYMNSQVGVLVFLIVKGDITQKADYAQALQVPGFVRHGPVDFTFSLQNTGNVHIMPTGTLTIYDWRNKQVAQLDVPPNIVLPDAAKQYTMAWQAKHAFGKFRAELAVTYGETTLPVATVTVWVVPWIKLSVAIVITAAIGMFVVKTRQRWRKAWQTLRGSDTKLGD